MSLRRRHIDYSGARPVSLVYRSNGFKDPGSNPHSYTAIDFGPESPDRAIIVCVQGTTDLTTVTVGGIAANPVVQRGQTGSPITDSIWIAAVPTGTTGTIVLNGAPGSWVSKIGVYPVAGLKSLTPTDTASDDDFKAGAFTKIVSTTVSVLGGGCAISSATKRIGTPTTVSWTGGTQDFLVDPGALSGAFSGAHNTPATSQSVTFTTQFNSGVSGALIGVSASFR